MSSVLGKKVDCSTERVIKDLSSHWGKSGRGRHGEEGRQGEGEEERNNILFTLSGKSIHLAGKVYKFFLDLAGKVYTFPTDKKRITFLCGKLGKVDKFRGMS